ncbi:MAG TPA: arsenate reductase family protein [Arenimonas sp.]|uniref:arsenate reductase family protein n=1 Tax=Arenimonas sp. TaxID=1872635 RepID=UPI002D809E89|nr:arsenate reductase family protein [Arenimonas sp.]HEU0152695.1 arsenate reductase family protein [Arenimonas sp.]
MQTLRYWHNPRCSKSREGLALLASRGVTPALVAYLDTPPSPAAVQALLAKLGGDPRRLVRFKEDEAAALGLSADDERPAEAWATLLAAHPRLIERPVLESATRAVIGRPTEALLALL